MTTASMISIIGGGLMGTGLAYVCSVAGHPVRVFEPDHEARSRFADSLEQIRSTRSPRGALSEVQVFDRLEEAVDDAELVIEAVPEILTLKRTLFQEIEKYAPARAILATNTSSIPLRDIAQGLADPTRFVGTHFWNPPHAIRLVEVVQGAGTSMRTVTTTMNLLNGLGMCPVHIRMDIPGIVGNRLQHALKREAIALVAQGVCSAEDLDTIVKTGFGPRLAVLGPLEQSDLVGLDLTLAIHENLIEDLDRTPRPHPMLVELVQRGHLGMRSGQGFRTWTDSEIDQVKKRLTTFLNPDVTPPHNTTRP